MADSCRMSFPSSFIDEIHTRVSLARIAGKTVTWDKKKTRAAKGDYWACCPFHNEKSPSFHVDDKKGFYYCFGCQARGGLISFIRETRNMEYREAVEYLAAEAGLAIPAFEKGAAEARSLEEQLFAIHEKAAKFFRLQLETSHGREARSYLEGRGVSPGAFQSFGLGYAPPGSRLLSHLRTAGYSNKQLVESGLAGVSESGNEHYDRFRDRIIFPIRDLRGRVIAFGGRAMDPGTGAKYLNSPETPIFKKGSTLYNLRSERTSASASSAFLLVEGYMDVIALSEAGFTSTVAPLGTAVTDHQLRIAWRFANEPIIVMDGDDAGRMAAMRMVDTALPLLEPGRTLRFCMLPKNSDPDDFVKDQGAAALSALLEKSEPLVEFLWSRETRNGRLDTPERQAAFERALFAAVDRIGNNSVRVRYRNYLRGKIFELFRRGGRPRGGNPQRPLSGQLAARATSAARESALAGSASVQSDTEGPDRLLEEAVLAICLRHPWLVREFETDLEGLTLTSESRAEILHAILRVGALGEIAEAGDFEARVDAEIGGSRQVARLFEDPRIKNIPALRGAESFNPKDALSEELAKILARQEKRSILSVAEEGQSETEPAASEALQWCKEMDVAVRALDEAAAGPDPRSGANYVPGSNGFWVDADEHAKLEELRKI